jgi:hypothetical protein
MTPEDRATNLAAFLGCIIVALVCICLFGIAILVVEFAFTVHMS